MRCRRSPGLALGAQAGEQRLREVATAAGFGRFRRVAQTPFNLVYEAALAAREGYVWTGTRV